MRSRWSNSLENITASYWSRAPSPSGTQAGQALPRQLRDHRVGLDAEVTAAELDRRRAGARRPGEGINHQVAGVGRTADDRQEQPEGQLGGNALDALLVGASHAGDGR